MSYTITLPNPNNVRNSVGSLAERQALASAVSAGYVEGMSLAPHFLQGADADLVAAAIAAFESSLPENITVQCQDPADSDKAKSYKATKAQLLERFNTLTSMEQSTTIQVACDGSRRADAVLLAFLASGDESILESWAEAFEPTSDGEADRLSNTGNLTIKKTTAAEQVALAWPAFVTGKIQKRSDVISSSAGNSQRIFNMCKLIAGLSADKRDQAVEIVRVGKLPPTQVMAPFLKGEDKLTITKLREMCQGGQGAKGKDNGQGSAVIKLSDIASWLDSHGGMLPDDVKATLQILHQHKEASLKPLLALKKQQQ